jgi:hypothetical protein
VGHLGHFSPIFRNFFPYFLYVKRSEKYPQCAPSAPNQIPELHDNRARVRFEIRRGSLWQKIGLNGYEIVELWGSVILMKDTLAKGFVPQGSGTGNRGERGRLEIWPDPHTLRYVPVSCPVPNTCPSMAFRIVAASTVPEGSTESSSAQIVRTYRWVLPDGGQGPAYSVFRALLIPWSSPPGNSWSRHLPYECHHASRIFRSVFECFRCRDYPKKREG